MIDMDKAINKITEVPDISCLIQLSDGQKSVLFKLQRFNRGLRYWLKDLLLPDYIAKDDFEENFYFSRPLANYLYNFRTLCFQLQPKYPQLIQSVDRLWVEAAQEKIQSSLANTGLTGKPSVTTKADHINGMREIIKSFQNHEACFLGNISKWDAILLIAQATAFCSPTFEDEAFQPFLKKSLEYVEQIQQCDRLQLLYLTPDGDEYVTGKRKKVPKNLQPFRSKLIKHEDLLQISDFVVRKFLGKILPIE